MWYSSANLSDVPAAIFDPLFDLFISVPVFCDGETHPLFVLYLTRFFFHNVYYLKNKTCSGSFFFFSSEKIKIIWKSWGRGESAVEEKGFYFPEENIQCSWLTFIPRPWRRHFVCCLLHRPFKKPSALCGWGLTSRWGLTLGGVGLGTGGDRCSPIVLNHDL